jgi:hypothetical protein
LPGRSHALVDGDVATLEEITSDDCTHVDTGGGIRDNGPAGLSMGGGLAQAGKSMKLVYYAMGKTDFLYASAAPTLAMLEKCGVKPVYRESGDGHTWINWSPSDIRKLAENKGSDPLAKRIGRQV